MRTFKLLLVPAIAMACNRTPPEPTGSPTTLTPATPATPTAPARPAAPGDGGPRLTRPTVTVPSGDPPTTLQSQDIVTGTGAEARSGQTVDVQYTGVAWSTHREFDSSWNAGRAFTFPLGRGSVIPGWDQGVVGMRVGGRRQLIIPPALGYGARGAGANIGPNETLVFVVDLVAVH